MVPASDVTRSFLDLRLLPALPVAWLPPWQRHSPQVSWQPIQTSVFLQIEAARPIYGYVQSPDFTPATSSPPSRFITLPARLLAFFFFFKVYNSRYESYIKAPTATSKRREATSRGAWEFFISCPHADITSSKLMFHISPVLRCFRKCAKMRTFESERVIALYNFLWVLNYFSWL